MHVAYVCSDLGVPIGGTKGASVHVRSVAQALARRGHKVTLFAAATGEDPPAGFLPQVVPIGYDPTLKAIRRRLSQLSAGSQKARETYALMLGSVAARELARVHAVEPISAVYERHSLWSWAALRFSHGCGVPHLLELNAPLVDETRRYRELSLADVAAACEGEVVAGVDGVIVPSRALGRHARRLGAAAERVHLVPNAVDPAAFTDPPPLDDPRAATLDGRFVVAFVGSLKPWHGIECLIDAFLALAEARPEAHLLVLGDGPMAPAVARLTEALGEDRITAPGAVPHALVPSWLHHAHVGVAPYPPLDDFYFSPMKIVEYQAAGLAVVASDIGHVREQVEDDSTGLLVEAGSAAALTQALLDLEADRGRATRLGAAARSRVSTDTTWDGVAGVVEELFREFTGSRFHRAGRNAAGSATR